MTETTETTEALQEVQSVSMEPLLPKKDAGHFTKKKFRKRRVVIPLVIVAVAFVGYKMTFGKTTPPPMVPTVPLVKQTLSSEVNLNGMVESANSVQVYSDLSNTVETLNVQVGDKVNAGDVLAQLDVSDLQISIAQQQAVMAKQSKLDQLGLASNEKDYENTLKDLTEDMDKTMASYDQTLKLAQRELADARADMNDHKDDLNHADDMMYDLEKRLNRARDAFKDAEEALNKDPDNEEKKQAYKDAEAAYFTAIEAWNDGDNSYGSDLSTYSKTYRRARLAYENALADRDIAKKDAERRLEELSDTIEKSKISSDMTSEQLVLKKYQKQLTDATIKAPVSGTVTAVYAKEGAPGSGLLFVIEDTDNLVVKTKIREYDVATVKEGMPAEIKADATGEKVFGGEVTRIYPAAIKTTTGEVKDEGSVEFETDVALLDQDGDLRVGMNVRLNVIRDKKDGVFAVPLDAVSFKENGDAVVYVAKTESDGKTTKTIAQPVVVQTGMETDFYIEISGDGLVEGDNVLSAAAGIVDGMEITAPAAGMPGGADMSMAVPE